MATGLLRRNVRAHHSRVVRDFLVPGRFGVCGGAHRGFVFTILKCQKNKKLAIIVAQTKNFSEVKLS